MNPGAWTKVKAARAAEVCSQFDLAEDARPLLRDGLAPREFVTALVAGRQYRAAIGFLAHALPPREAVWWGCLCLKHVSGTGLSAAEDSACKAAVQWVLEPNEDNRRRGRATGEAAGVGTPAGAVALGASWTGGSLSPPGLPAVAPAPFLPARGVAAGVLLAATRADPQKFAETQRLFVELGVGVAEGRFTWPDGKKKRPAG